MLACLTLLFLGVGLGHLFHLYTEKNRDPEKCTAPVIVFYNNTQANLTLDFMYSLKKRTGVVSISGTYYVDNKMSGVIRRDVSYVWSENKDSTHFISTDINKVTRDETLSDAVIETVFTRFLCLSREKYQLHHPDSGPSWLYVHHRETPDIFLYTLSGFGSRS
ncbi:YqeJ protein [Salmonella enterica]|uniref:YqeJ protein n=1 Tax=Salmonella enterica TaxID=28901 RepID=A0A7D8IP03_SALER|nr:YqeJ protein [Salmonella enterica]